MPHSIRPEVVEALRRSPYAWWEWDCATNVVRFHDRKASVLGYDPDALRNRGCAAFTELLHPDDYDATMAAMTTVLVIDLGVEAEVAGSAEAVLEIARNSLAVGQTGLESLLVICSSCHRIKQNRRQWVDLTPELLDLLGVQLSHGICPDCIRALYPDYADRILGRDD